jgi:hypothetical protein
MSKRTADELNNIANNLMEPLSQELQWVSASRTANWMRNDPILDYFEMYCSERPFHIPNIINDVSIENSEKNPRTEVVVEKQSIPVETHDFIMQLGKDFEQAVVSYIKKNFTSDFLQIAHNSGEIMLESKANATFDAMKKGIPFIYQGVLHDWDHKTFGSPDFIVRSDYLHKLVKTAPLTQEEWQIGAPKLFNPFEISLKQKNIKAKRRGLRSKTISEQPKYHYVIVDVKYSTLKMRTDNVHLTNSGHMAAYKAQMYIYQRALSKLQGYDPKCTYLLGRNWSMVKTGVKHRGKGPFEKLGAINFHEPKLDQHIIAKTEDAVNWIRRLRQEGMLWTLYPKPSVYELYPNMSNKHDSPWHEKKKELAENIHEITSVWYCGVKQRKRAHDAGITEWTDPKLSADNLGFKKRKNDDEKLRLGDIVDEILDINRQDIDPIRPIAITNNFRNWQTSDEEFDAPIEFYVDFETIHDAAASTAQSNVNNLAASTFGSAYKGSFTDMIFMVGVGWMEPISDNPNEMEKIWRYRNFTAETMTFESERKILNDFYYLIKMIFDREVARRQHKTPNFWQALKAKINKIASAFRRGTATLEEVRNSQLHVNLYHWGHIEKKAFERAMERHPREKFHDDLVSNNWVNFYDIMRNEPIVIKGALSFGLKAVVRALNDNGLIQVKYADDSCANGMQAMADAVAVYKSGDNIAISKKMNSIVEYNEVDCKAVYAIINYFRSNHSHKLLVNFEEVDESEPEPEQGRIKRRDSATDRRGLTSSDRDEEEGDGEEGEEEGKNPTKKINIKTIKQFISKKRRRSAQAEEESSSSQDCDSVCLY